MLTIFYLIKLGVFHQEKRPVKILDERALKRVVRILMLLKNTEELLRLRVFARGAGMCAPRATAAAQSSAQDSGGYNFSTMIKVKRFLSPISHPGKH
jgi:hypothetical protein